MLFIFVLNKNLNILKVLLTKFLFILKITTLKTIDFSQYSILGCYYSKNCNEKLFIKNKLRMKFLLRILST